MQISLHTYEEDKIIQYIKMWTGLNKLIAQNEVHKGDNIQNIEGSILINISGRFIIPI